MPQFNIILKIFGHFWHTPVINACQALLYLYNNQITNSDATGTCVLLDKQRHWVCFNPVFPDAAMTNDKNDDFVIVKLTGQIQKYVVGLHLNTPFGIFFYILEAVIIKLCPSVTLKGLLQYLYLQPIPECLQETEMMLKTNKKNWRNSTWFQILYAL